MKVATLRARRVRVAMLHFCIGERAIGTHRKCAGAAGGEVAEFPPFLILGVFGVEEVE